ncbi:MAG TPA: ATP-binding cassette domain-containing protein [Thermoanaerobaculia bacterium]|nr:ATP-binding cassette domain-containing protein [Thermoanaerobaculia bacterium]
MTEHDRPAGGGEARSSTAAAGAAAASTPPGSSERPAILVSGLRFSYPAPRPGSGGVAFQLSIEEWRVEHGARVALHGPSGCGKSTLLDLLAGVLRPDAGSLEIEGEDLTQLGDEAVRAHRIRTLGFVFQDFPLVEYLDAVENVLFPYRLNPVLRLDASARARARDLLGGLDLAGKEGRLPRELSVGERQRVAIARALVTGPRLLLADEPTAGLDPDQSLAVVRQLEAASRDHGLTLVMVTHDPTLLGRFDQTLAVQRLAHTGEAA